MFYYVYILQSLKDKSFYIGYTKDLQIRIKQHNNGETESIKNKTPLRLIYYEAHLNQYIAIEREKFFKSGWGRKFIKEKLKISN